MKNKNLQVTSCKRCTDCYSHKVWKRFVHYHTYFEGFCLVRINEQTSSVRNPGSEASSRTDCEEIYQAVRHVHDKLIIDFKIRAGARFILITAHLFWIVQGHHYIEVGAGAHVRRCNSENNEVINCRHKPSWHSKQIRGGILPKNEQYMNTFCACSNVKIRSETRYIFKIYGFPIIVLYISNLLMHN